MARRSSTWSRSRSARSPRRAAAVGAVALLHARVDGDAGRRAGARATPSSSDRSPIPAVGRPAGVRGAGRAEPRRRSTSSTAGPRRSDESIARAVAGDLAVLLGTPRVATAPLANFDPTYRVTIDVQRFESTPGQAVLVDAVWVVRRTARRRDALGPHGRARAVQGGASTRSPPRTAARSPR